jgi:hypothetical protein
MQTVKAFFESHGFHLEETGGGCSAWVRQDMDNQETFVTVDDPVAPMEWTDFASVTTCVDGNHGEPRTWETVEALRLEVERNFPGYIL